MAQDNKLAARENPIVLPQVMSTNATQVPCVISQAPALIVPRSHAQSALIDKEERLDYAKWRPLDFAITAKQLIGDVYRNARERAVDTFTNLASASRDVTRRARTR